MPAEFFSIDGVEFYSQVSFLKAGLFYSDRLTTVSPTYAREIQTPDFGWGLDGLLRSRAAVLTGILNGVDPANLEPAARSRTCRRPMASKTRRQVSARRRRALQSRLGLAQDQDAPLFGVVSRLTWQKGLDLLLSTVPGLVAAGGQLALLGSGDADLEQGFTAAARTLSAAGSLSSLATTKRLSHLIFGGADIVLLPSRFEPCGLTQLYALRYGALPLVRRVGGLADTVVDATAVTLADGTATGFAFDEESPAALLAAVGRASGLMREPGIWRRMIRRAMTRDFSWDAAARQYLALYHAIEAGRPT